MTRRHLAAIVLFALALEIGSTAPAAALLAAQVVASDAQGAPGRVIFRYVPTKTVDRVHVAGTFNGWSPVATPLRKTEGAEAWETTIDLGAGKHLYKFVVDGTWLLDPLNARVENDGRGNDNSVLVLGGGAAGDSVGTPRLTAYSGPDAETPDWAERAVWYQIFPERFRNGEESNDPPGAIPWRHPWFEPAGSESGDFYRYVFDRRYGGDLQGVVEKLDYLEELGVTALYFNPIFEAPSLHKYDTADYRHVDDNFGTRGDIGRLAGETDDPTTWKWTESDRLFLRLVDECHKRGIRVIVDGVFNHTGNEHYAFRDVLARGEASPYATWYKINSWGPPIDYEGWWGVETLPEIAQRGDGLDPTFTRHVHAITRRWMDPNGDGDPSDGIDGWRLDVPTLVPKGFWVEWRALVKSINKDAYIVGEIWDPEPGWLDGRTFDAQMNYPLLRAITRFFIDTNPRSTPTEFAREIEILQSLYPRSVVYAQQNLLDSHDTDRVASAIVNPNRKFDAANRLQDEDGKQYDPRKPDPSAYQRLKLITIFQMTYVGAPMVWYGDEVGMWGPDDPSDRKPMLWKDLEPYVAPEDRVNEDLLRHYTKVIAIRNSNGALQTGSYRTLVTDDAIGVMAFERTIGTERIVVVLNNSDRRRIVEVPVADSDGAAYHDELNDPNYRIRKGSTAETTTMARRLEYTRPKEFTTRVQNGRLRVDVGEGWGAILVRRSE